MAIKRSDCPQRQRVRNTTVHLQPHLLHVVYDGIKISSLHPPFLLVREEKDGTIAEGEWLLLDLRLIYTPTDDDPYVEISCGPTMGLIGPLLLARNTLWIWTVTRSMVKGGRTKTE